MSTSGGQSEKHPGIGHKPELAADVGPMAESASGIGQMPEHSSGIGPMPEHSSGIGTRNERSLHAAIKDWYAQPGDRTEVKVDGFVVDIVRGDCLIEVQTRNFSAIRRKLHTLTKSHKLLLLYPIAREKWIVRMDTSGRRVLGRRKSPRRGELADLFDELVAIPDLIADENLQLAVVLIHEEEVRCADGRGSRWRKGYSVRDRRLVKVIEEIPLRTVDDFRRFLPPELTSPFTNKNLATALDKPVHRVRPITYCLRKMGLIVQTGKRGKEFLYTVIP